MNDVNGLRLKAGEYFGKSSARLLSFHGGLGKEEPDILPIKEMIMETKGHYYLTLFMAAVFPLF